MSRLVQFPFRGYDRVLFSRSASVYVSSTHHKEERINENHMQSVMPPPSLPGVSQHLTVSNGQAVLPVITLQDLLQTGLSIKIRFLLALTLIALLPAIVLVLLLGDPTGREQQGNLGQAFLLQAQAQSSALDQSFSMRKSLVAVVAAQPAFELSVTGAANPILAAAQKQQGALPPSTAHASSQEILQTEFHADPASLAWLLVGPDGSILETGNPQDHLTGTPLVRMGLLSVPSPLEKIVQVAAKGSVVPLPLFGLDT